MDLRRILLYAAERNPGLPATVEAAASYTYDEWVQRGLALADGLAARGVRHGDRVAIGMRNSIVELPIPSSSLLISSLTLSLTLCGTDGLNGDLSNTSPRSSCSALVKKLPIGSPSCDWLGS